MRVMRDESFGPVVGIMSVKDDNEAISLMNDSRYAYQVTKNLVKMGGVLFSTAERPLREAEQSVSLDERELAEALGTPNNEKGGTNDEHP